MRTSDRVLLAMGAFLVAFIGAMTVTFWRFGGVFAFNDQALLARGVIGGKLFQNFHAGPPSS